MPSSAKIERHDAGEPRRIRLKGFGLPTSLLLAVAAAFFTFFASTALAIFSLLGWNLLGHHAVNYADSYLLVGVPAGLLVLMVALAVFGVLWVRSKLQG
jgi:uncharacterized membrane protein